MSRKKIVLLGKMAGYWPRSFFWQFMDLNALPVHKNAKKKPWPVSSHLEPTHVQQPICIGSLDRACSSMIDIDFNIFVFPCSSCLI